MKTNLFNNTILGIIVTCVFISIFGSINIVIIDSETNITNIIEVFFAIFIVSTSFILFLFGITHLIFDVLLGEPKGRTYESQSAENASKVNHSSSSSKNYRRQEHQYEYERAFAGTPRSDSSSWTNGPFCENGDNNDYGFSDEEHERQQHNEYRESSEDESEEDFSDFQKRSEIEWCYLLLGVSTTATPDEIRRAYRMKARIHHPDKGGDEDTMRALNRAYEYLKKRPHT